MYPSTHTCTHPPLSTLLTRMVLFFLTKDEPKLTHHNNPKSVVHLRVHSWFCAVYGFGQKYNDTSIIITSYKIFLLPSKFCPLPTHLMFVFNNFQPVASNKKYHILESKPVTFIYLELLAQCLG